MKKLAYTLVVVLAAAGALYSLGLGPFKEGTATGQQQRGTGGDAGAVSVRVGRVRVGDIEERLSYVGTLLANAQVTVAPKVAGRVEILFVNVGDPVKEGQLLAQLDKDELAEEVKEAEASVQVSEATLKGKEAELGDLKRRLDRYRILSQKNFIAQEDVDTLDSQTAAAAAQVDLARAQTAQMKARLDNASIRLKHTDVISPFAGYVARRFLDRGALINPTTPLATIVDIDPVKVVLAVVEKDYRKVSPGQAAAVAVDAYPGRQFHGKVVRMAPVLDQETRTGEVEIELANPQEILKPGMFARAEIVAEERRGVLLAPEGAQVKRPEGYGVFQVLEDAPRVRFVVIEPGLAHEGWVEVRSGLTEGARVVTLGSSLLRDGQRIRVIDGNGMDEAPREKDDQKLKGQGKKKGKRS